MTPAAPHESRLRDKMPRMLITDDDRGWRETLREVFLPRGFDTIMAADGSEAWEIVQEQTVHIVLLDMHMPHMTGLELLQRLQQDEKILPCVLMSAALDDSLARKARRAQARSVVSKPVPFRQLTGLVHEIMLQVYDWQG